MTSTNSAVITELMPVLAPAFMLTAERENEPDTGKAWVKLPTMLARPWPISSWLGSMRCLVLAAMALAMEMASMKPTSEITRAADSSEPSASRLKLGICDAGQAFGDAAHHLAAADQLEAFGVELAQAVAGLVQRHALRRLARPDRSPGSRRSRPCCAPPAGARSAAFSLANAASASRSSIRNSRQFSLHLHGADAVLAVRLFGGFQRGRFVGDLRIQVVHPLRLRPCSAAPRPAVRVGDLLERAVGVAFEADRPGQQRRHHHGDQHARAAWARIS